MKRILYSLLILAGMWVSFAACNSGAYVANPTGGANTSINPLNPLKANQFTWSGTAPFSAVINGNQWNADTASFNFSDTTGTNILMARKGNSYFMIALQDVYAINVYNMGFKTYNRYAWYVDSLNLGSGFYYASVAPNYYVSYLGNSGEVFITENDSAFIKGEFYFQGVNGSGDVISVNNGYFYIAKPI